MPEERSIVMTFPEPREVYLVDIHGEAVPEPLLRRDDLWSGAGIAIRNPWNEERFLPGTALGDGAEFVMEVGQSLGKLIFHETQGWLCVALVNRDEVMSAVMDQLIEEAKEASRSFTEKLTRAAAKQKRSSKGTG